MIVIYTCIYKSCNKGEKQILLETAENVFLTNFNCVALKEKNANYELFCMYLHTFMCLIKIT